MNDSIYSIETLKELARKVDRMGNGACGHSEEVAQRARELCKALNVRGKRREIVIEACLIHDVGRIGVDAAVWSKTEKLNDIDWHQIKQHPAIGAKLAQRAGYEKHVVQIVYNHHVWYNGRGYPKSRRKGARIPLGARILAVCDAYEAMISKRPYREAKTSDEAIQELKKNVVKQFDPRIVEVFAERVVDNNAEH